MGSNKHKHKSRKRKHYRSSDSSEKEYEKDRHKHRKKHHKERKEKRPKTILVDESETSGSEDDVIIVVTPPPPKISHRNLSTSPVKKVAKIQPRVSPQSQPPLPPPPPKISRHRSRTPTPPNTAASPRSVSPQNSSSDASLSIEETNKLRVKLGLKPLDVSDKYSAKNENHEKKETFGGVDMGDFVHKPAENITSKSKSEKLKEKLQLRREKRTLEEKLRKVKKLNEACDSDDDDVSKWVEKNRRIISEKEQAERRAKELDAMDEVFGIGELIEEDTQIAKKMAYTSKDLVGLKVEHDMDSLKEERDVILTLKDKPVLDEEQDTLINVNIVDDERYKKNIDRRRQKPGYNAYEDEFTEMESMIEKKVLAKYDEEIQGEKRSSFTLGTDAQMIEEAKKESIRNKLQQYAVGKRLENLSFTLQPASEYYTDQEIAYKFKKPKKKVRKIRKIKPLKADDLLYNMVTPPPVKQEPRSNGETAENRVIKSTSSFSATKVEVKEKPDYDCNLMDIDDLPPAIPLDTDSVKIEVNDEDDLDLQLALHRARKLQQSRTLPISNNEEQTDEMDVEDLSTSDIATGGSIVLNATAEFCRTLGDIPTYGQAGNREEDVQELLDFEKEVKVEKGRKEDIDSLTSGWNEVAMDSTPIDITTSEVPILDAEPDISCGVAGALRMAISKGYIQTETEKRPSAVSRTAHLQAQNYSIEDKAHSLEDDKHARRERYSGPTSDFKEKDGYKPNVKLEYIDDDGHILSAKEAFRYLSHKFHGKGPGKNKIEKRMKKSEQEALMKQMSSTDTPLSTLKMLQEKQKRTQTPYVVLSGSKHGHSTNIAK